MIEVLEIAERLKPFWVIPADPGNFALRPAGAAPAQLLLEDPTVTIYCFDPENRRVLFVQTPAGWDLLEEPFFYKAQYDHAERLYALPYDLFHQLASRIPETGHLVHIHSTGRAGSTLLSKAFGEVQSATSVSESDIYSQAARMRFSGAPDEEIVSLLRSGTAFLFKPSFTRGSALNVVKHRSTCIEAADLIARAREAHHVFLYRDLEGYVRSSVRAFGFGNAPPEVRRRTVRGMGGSVPLLRQEGERRADLDSTEIAALMWLSTMHAFTRLSAGGLPMLPVRYEDLVGRPREIMSGLVAYLGLPASSVDAALRAFERDSQEGSPLARAAVGDRDDRITPEQWALVRDLVERYPLPFGDVPEATVAVPA